MASPLISFVIPVRNDAERLRRCLGSILANASEGPIEIIVADNGSTDRSAVVATEAGATVLDLPRRPVSQLRNLAAQRARGDFIAFVDADHALAPGWIAGAVGRMADPEVWAVGAEYHAPADATWVQRMYDAFRAHERGVREVDWLPSGNLVVRRSAFDTIRGFDEGLESCEDVDFCRRIRESGGKLVSDPGLHSIHFGDPRTLRALFLSELWRGRDNIRVSLRERLTLRSAPGLVIPIANLVALAAILAGVVLMRRGGWWLVASGLTVFISATTLRAVRLLSHIPAADRRLSDAPRAIAVAATYDLARALALVSRASHDLRRKA